MSRRPEQGASVTYSSFITVDTAGSYPRILAICIFFRLVHSLVFDRDTAIVTAISSPKSEELPLKKEPEFSLR